MVEIQPENGQVFGSPEAKNIVIRFKGTVAKTKKETISLLPFRMFQEVLLYKAGLETAL